MDSDKSNYLLFNKESKIKKKLIVCERSLFNYKRRKKIENRLLNKITNKTNKMLLSSS